jgi:glycosyltransferase involved in cell wall biosynthesis
MNPKVSVVMSVFNTEDYLKEALDSILSQTFTDFEFIVINDGSTDRSGDILHHYQSFHDVRLKIYSQENCGLVHSLNKGCALARAEYIARMDSDDISFPDRIERQVSFLEQNPRVAVLGGAVILMNSVGKPVDVVRYPEKDPSIKRDLLRYDCLAHPTIVMRKEAFKRAGGYRSSFRHAEDYDLWLRMAERFELANLPEPVLYHRIHEHQVSYAHIPQQTLSTLAAQTLAKKRKESGIEPPLQFDIVTPYVLDSLGVSLATITRQSAETYSNKANLMLKFGNEAVASQLLESALKIAPSTSLRRKFIAGFFIESARLNYKKGFTVKAILSALKACSLKPSSGMDLGRSLMARISLKEPKGKHATQKQ